MSVLNSIWEASIDNIKFIVRDDETKGGRRKAYYEYISTNRRQAQDLGQYLKKFIVNGYIIYNPNVDGDYITKRNQLVEVLETNKTHILIHPFYGTVNVSTGLYTLKQSFSELGRAYISFEAVEVSNSINNSLPIAGGDITQQTINDIADACKKNITEFNRIDIIKKFKDAYEATKDVAINTFRNIQDILSPIITEIDESANFIREIENDIDNVNDLINDPTALVIRIVDLISGIDGLSNNIIHIIAGLKRFNELGNSINQFTSNTTDTDKKNISLDALSPNIKINTSPITFQDAEIKKNTDTIINTVKQISLVSQFRLSSQVTFENTNDIKNSSNDLESQYYDVKATFSDNLIDNFSKLRSNTSSVFDKKRLNTSNEIDLELFDNMPLSVLCYDLYDNSLESENIKNLNKLNDTIAVNNTIKVLTDART